MKNKKNSVSKSTRDVGLVKRCEPIRNFELIKHCKPIRNFALSQGFDLIGFSQIKPNAAAYNHYKKWLDKKFEADMLYMSKKEAILKRKSAANLLKNAKSVISLAINYYHPQPPLPKGHGRIARYAYGRDYHKIIKKKLEAVEEFIKEKFQIQSLNYATNPTGINSAIPQTLSYVDTGPILERAFAVQAGLGFIGKNSCLTTKEFGSWVFLAEIITDLEILPQNPICKAKRGTASGDSLAATCPGADFVQPGAETCPGTDLVNSTPKILQSCGTCNKCLEACPTKAITKDRNGKYFINAKKCLSYLTIEFKGPSSKIPKELKQAMFKSKRLFGCDICQEACPRNCRAKNSTHKEFTNPAIAGDSIPIKKIFSMENEEEFVKSFAGSPLMRAKLKSLRRNAKILNH